MSQHCRPTTYTGGKASRRGLCSRSGLECSHRFMGENMGLLALTTVQYTNRLDQACRHGNAAKRPRYLWAVTSAARGIRTPDPLREPDLKSAPYHWAIAALNKWSLPSQPPICPYGRPALGTALPACAEAPPALVASRREAPCILFPCAGGAHLSTRGSCPP